MSTEPKTPTREDTSRATSEDGDTFDDAPDITPRPRQRSPEATRSLTDRRPSSTSTLNKEKPQSPVASRQMPEGATMAENGGATTPPTTESNGDKKSPSLNVHSISLADMDEVNLEEDGNMSSHTRAETQTSISTIPLKHPPEDASNRASSPQRIAPPSVPNPEKAVPASGLPSMTRKFNSPFSWLSRATTSLEKKPQSPPPLASPPPQSQERRNTTSSVNSHADLMVNRFKDDKDGAERSSVRDSQDSLKSKFKDLRHAAETGRYLHDIQTNVGNANGGTVAGFMGRSQSIALGVSSPTALSPDEEKGEAQVVPMMRGGSSPGPRGGVRRPSVNPNLQPGTASGMDTGTDSAGPVDWDLWQAVVTEGPAAVARTSPEELNSSIANGIPHAIRGVIWQVLANSKNDHLEAIYHELVARGTDKEKALTNGHASLGSISSKDKESVASSASSVHSEQSTPATTGGAVSPQPSQNGDHADEMTKLQNGLIAAKAKDLKDDLARIQKLEKIINRDLGSRTSYSKYKSDPNIQAGLFGVCKAYALYDEAVGYAQGMNFIVMPLLLNMNHEEAFCIFVRLMSKYGMREMFIRDMPGLHLQLYQFERLLEDFEPALYCHLHRRGVDPTLYATQWFLTLFVYRFPLSLTIRIYDLLLSEGLGAILKIAIALMRQNRETLLGMKDMSQLTTFLKERLFDVYIDKQPSQKSLLDAGFFGSGGDNEVYYADKMVLDACAVRITPEMLERYKSEWEEKVRLEKERENEVESLRQQCSSLTQKVRKLEEHAEKSDVEHIQVASELVRTKVENEALQDENESLRGQVDELKNVVQHQTEEVEKRMRAEMDAVMQRNKEVHDENRRMEEETQDMEKLLVETKMQYAQINSEYETLKQKWNNMREMLNSK